MIKQPRAYCDHAINALFHLVGGVSKQVFPPGMPTALMLAHCGLAITAGDEHQPLDPHALKPFAARHGMNVMATWTDRMLSGHAFEIDVVLNAGGTLDHHQALRLWVMPNRGTWLVPPDGEGRMIAVDSTGIRLTPQRPFQSRADLMLGTAAGQALLQSLIYGGSAFATPLPENFGR